jgi:hypothetical protein
MRDSATIQVKDNDTEVLFQWNGFDGDDCFGSFHIDVVTRGATERFRFGECAVWGLRKSVRFFRGRLDRAESGFRFPDIRTYDLTRTEDGFMLQICLEAANRSKQYRLSKPTLFLDDEFLREYDGDRYSF